MDGDAEYESRGLPPVENWDISDDNESTVGSGRPN